MNDFKLSEIAEANKSVVSIGVFDLAGEAVGVNARAEVILIVFIVETLDRVVTLATLLEPIKCELYVLMIFSTS
jgi:hypothetical protein